MIAAVLPVSASSTTNSLSPVLASVSLALCDAYDAMSHDRPYREALDAASCREELRRGAGGQFDPELAEQLARLLESRAASRGQRRPG